METLRIGRQVLGECQVQTWGYWFSNLMCCCCCCKLLQSCPTLCNPRNGSPRGSPIPGILQARTLEWAAISFSNAWTRKVKVKSFSRVWLLATPWTTAYQAPPSMGFPGKSSGVGCHCLLQPDMGPWQTLLSTFQAGFRLRQPTAPHPCGLILHEHLWAEHFACIRVILTPAVHHHHTFL